MGGITMKPSEYLIYVFAILASLWLTWFLFTNIHQALGIVGIGLALMLVLWLLEAIAEDLGSMRNRK